MYQSRPSRKRPGRSLSPTEHSLRRRLDTLEREQQLLRNTLSGVAQEQGVSVAGECGKCNRSYLLISQGRMHCPTCGYGRSI
ncbi:hypothetical protein [Natronobacterium gregoryi]|uniref:Uncharacterized protein n=1 Tax=Natronobacterium gregoryi (strain ATCC 43098 / DSM 3393 / CCM 3738 / CIP 104747 / IAM 13177 / JCM 8860 / NBRC 102187 / NCIMB 2189 / SP2) TaxID=797304 RepID=L9XPE0_NATGS|nr:hypothetical protein [Natronobacterium gregoryi]ELY63674.1 hypothetical protein C490_15529 [Natronobacterium gregoryi SP2]PLK21994.1 hypothetical protein CYV19_00950 [Natronobacterium gregoryi SP2]